MGWLTNEVVQGLAFNAGSTFDPPNELKPWRMQPDLSLGFGVLPLNKARFPRAGTPGLEALGPQSFFPDRVVFPNLTFHLRLGLPGRYDMTLRAADMTLPKGTPLSGSTRGDGQSNTLGIGLRRHFLSGDGPRVTLGLNFNYVFGRFHFVNKFNAVELTPGFTVDSENNGNLNWNVSSLGLNAVISQTYGAWTPFLGAGYNHMAGSVRARLQADFATPLIQPSVGEASDRPEQNQARVIFGAQFDRKRLSLFLNGEVKAVGASAGKTFIVSTGLVAPFRIGAGSFVGRPREKLRDAPASGKSAGTWRKENDRALPRGSATEPSGEGVPPPRSVGERPATEGSREAAGPRQAPASDSDGKEQELPEMIFIR